MGDCSHEIKRCLLLERKVMTNLDSIFKSRDITLSTKVHLVKAMVFPVDMYGCESWSIKKAEHWRIDDFELYTLESPLDCKEIQPVHPKAHQSLVFIGRTDSEAAAPILWPPDAKSWLSWKDPDSGKDWGQEERGQQRMRWLDGHGFGWTPGAGYGQGGLVCCHLWGCKESDTTEQLNWTELKNTFYPKLLIAVPRADYAQILYTLSLLKSYFICGNSSDIWSEPSEWSHISESEEESQGWESDYEIMRIIKKCRRVDGLHNTIWYQQIVSQVKRKWIFLVSGRHWNAKPCREQSPWNIGKRVK